MYLVTCCDAVCLPSSVNIRRHAGPPPVHECPQVAESLVVAGIAIWFYAILLATGLRPNQLPYCIILYRLGALKSLLYRFHNMIGKAVYRVLHELTQWPRAGIAIFDAKRLGLFPRLMS
jgi:hypothetical protein